MTPSRGKEKSMIVFFAKALANESGETKAVVLSFRGHAQTLPGGSIVLGFIAEDKTYFDEEMIKFLVGDMGSKVDLTGEISNHMMRLAESYGWNWNSSYPGRTREIQPCLWLGDHYEVTRRLMA